MTTDITLRTKILFYFVGLIFLSSLTTIFAVIYATNNSVEIQAREKLSVGQKVFGQLLDMRSDQLFESAEVLTADFGFKSAVLTGDQSTIQSALENQSARIDADLMVLTSLEGDLIAATRSGKNFEDIAIDKMLPEAEKFGGLAPILVIDGKPFKTIMLSINAPIPQAWAIVGFEMDLSLAQQLKELTELEVAFTGSGENGREFELTTLSFDQDPFDRSSLDSNEWLSLSKQGRDYLASVIPLSKEYGAKVYAVLSTSLASARESFSPLKAQILTIAMIALLISSAAGFVMSKNITRPINRLVTAAKQISDGDYGVKILDERFKQSEIKTLATSLDHMQRGIADRESKILFQVYHDALTGLENREALILQLDALMSTSRAAPTHFGLMQLDVRRFKEINDTFGYQAGDQLLISIADRLKTISAPTHTAFRLGADEFLILLFGDNSESIKQSFTSLTEQLSGNYENNGLTVSVAFYAGLALYPDHGDEAEQLMRRADIALNKAKQERSRSEIYEQGSDEKHLKQLRLVNDLKIAIDEGHLQLFYQPKLDLKANQVTQVESLLRWIHDDLGFISPGEFIPLAEQSGLMPPLTRWVIAEAAQQSKRFRAEGINLQIAINLSAYDLSNEDLPDFIENTLNEVGGSPDTFIFEVTESAMMQDPELALSVLERLKTLGFSLAVDDYGTGYSSLSQLKGMPVDELKIDMSFVLKLDESQFDQAIVKSTIEMGHNLGLSIVAEGVENLASWKLLEKWGCDKLQGYYISKPQKANAFIDWYRDYSVPQEAG